MNRAGVVRWRWRLIAASLAFICVLTFNAIAFATGFSPVRRDPQNFFETLVCYLNLPGGLVALFTLGDPLANPLDQAAQRWNDCCAMGGGVVQWTMIAFAIGWYFDNRDNSPHVHEVLDGQSRRHESYPKP